MAALQASLIGLADMIAYQTGFGRRLPSAGELMHGAAKSARRTGFSDSSFIEPLNRLLAAYENEADLSLFGWFAARWDISRCLANLLRFEEEEECSPHIVRTPVTSPVFVTGMPRSGTTFFHMLLAQDPGNRVPLCWQTIYPYPKRGAASPDLRAALVERQFKTFEGLTPELHKVHPLTARTPQECTEITGQIFQSLRYDTTHFVPYYQAWLNAAGHVQAFKFHKRFLQHLQAQSGPGQWVLKCPDHVFTLDAILSVYPDARFVFVHRDPISVLPSVAKLTELLRKPFTRSLDKKQIGRQVVDRWAQGADLIRSAGNRPDLYGRIFHVHYKRLVRDPLGSLAGFYEYFDLPFSMASKARIQDLVERNPRGGYFTNHYSFEEFGLDPSALRDRFQAYTSAFDIEDEKRRPAFGGALVQSAA